MNLFAALRAAFPADLDAIAVETEQGLAYSWRDLERGTAMIANLLQSLGLEEGARVAVQVEKSVEAMMLYLATLRAGYVFLPLNTAYQKAEIEYFVGNAEPAVVVCSPGLHLPLVARGHLCRSTQDFIEAGLYGYRGARRILELLAHTLRRAETLDSLNL